MLSQYDFDKLRNQVHNPGLHGAHNESSNNDPTFYATCIFKMEHSKWHSTTVCFDFEISYKLSWPDMERYELNSQAKI